ncbi:hypothetical protein FE783_30085 [Paenibacillus mesophilus]|uniref:hypothetical protein n=1 Tax=Paenibacillus mesophilus TaxID=2582849 RepID=UPI00110E1AC4|nr:hypothetical protein [Paenibacillus mesophilus]TMV45112.1 hypothetical protein FE783_30085 [Paenibacillus mesophilus]
MIDLTERLGLIGSISLRYPELTESVLSGETVPAATRTDKSCGSSHVCAGSLVSIAAGICDEHRDDVLESTLFAQFAANGRYQRDTETDQWYSVYVQTLILLGWNTVGFRFQKYAQLPEQFQLFDAILELTSGTWTKSAQDSLTVMLRALGSFKSTDRRIQLLGVNSVTASAGNFQLGVAENAKGDQVQMQTMAVLFNSQGIPADFLFDQYAAASVNLFASSQMMVLNDNVYSRMRSTVRSRLNTQIQQFIVSIPLS